jgi:phosphatidate cytidylyltransferase
MKQRTMTALVLLCILLPIVFIGETFFNLAVIAIGVFGLKEMINIRDSKYPLSIAVKLIAYASFIYFVVSMPVSNVSIYLLDYRIIAFTMLLLLMPIIIYHDNHVYNINDALFLVGSVFLLGISVSLLIVLREQNLMRVLYLFIITTMTDTYALIGGMLVVSISY